MVNEVVRVLIEDSRILLKEMPVSIGGKYPYQLLGRWTCLDVARNRFSDHGNSPFHFSPH
jgi:hypothetical protein